MIPLAARATRAMSRRSVPHAAGPYTLTDSGFGWDRRASILALRAQQRPVVHSVGRLRTGNGRELTSASRSKCHHPDPTEQESSKSHPSFPIREKLPLMMYVFVSMAYSLLDPVLFRSRLRVSWSPTVSRPANGLQPHWRLVEHRKG